jgi:putative oxidoreductase
MATREAIHPGTSAGTSARNWLHIALWGVQGLLAATFISTGLMKATSPVAQLQANMPWVSGTMGQLVRFIGTVELLGALGLILPAATRIKPWLTPLAALGLTTVMVLAAATHVARGEFSLLGGTVILGGLAAFVAWGRFRKAPIPARS